MTQYIDKSAVVAEIERRKKYYENIQTIKPVYESNIEDFNELLSFIDTIEAKKAGLERRKFKEIKEDYWRTLRHQATISAMQAWVSDHSNITMLSIIANKKNMELLDMITDTAINTANGLIERLKDEAD